VDHDEVIVALNGEGEVVRALIGHFGWNLPLTVWDLRRAIVTYCGAERKRRLRSNTQRGILSEMAIFHQLAAVTLELPRHESPNPRN
jgi:hypothetical protein